MSKGISGLFHGTFGSKIDCTVKQNYKILSTVTGQIAKQDDKPVNGTDFNSAGSNSVGKVNSVTTTQELHSIPAHGTPNSVSKNYREGKLDSERYYDKNGDAYLDIDYSDHGNSKTHPNVPHEHSIYFDQNGKMHRDDEPQGGLNK